MATKRLNARLQLRYDTYANWMNSNTILLAGEIAVAAMYNRKTITLSDAEPDNTPPAIGIKVGDGTHYFYELPWVQAIAADVYKWAKASSPPNASSIPGLNEYIQSYIENTGGGSGVSTAYRIIFDNNNNKYVLQTYNDEIEEWENTDSEINFTPILNRIQTIENWANGAYQDIGNIEMPIVAYIQDIVNTFIGRLGVDDNAVNHQFVTSVSEANGKITVTRKTIAADDITSGVFSTAQGGTGFSSVDLNEILIGSQTGKLKKANIATILNDDDRTAIPTSGAVLTYVDNVTAGLTGAMHFIGEANIDILSNPRSDPQISGYDFRKAQPGDVVLSGNAQEFVWTGNSWRLLGDEGSYAVKGSIKDADIDAEANIQQSKILGLADSFNLKVDKVEGKGLSTNDYTDEEKSKLLNIEDNAQVNLIEHTILNGIELLPHTVNNIDKTIEINIAEFDQASREKLASIETGAQVNIINGISLNGASLSPNNDKIISLTIREFSEEDKLKLDSIEAGAQVNIIDSIYLNGRQVSPDQNKRIDLSIREYPLVDEQKLQSIESGAQVNIIEGIKVDGQTLYPDNNKIISITTDPHTEHINKIEGITVNGTTIVPDQNKIANITIDAPTLNLIHGAEVPDGLGGKESVDVINKQLQFAAIAKSGDVKHLVQTRDTYIILNCGSSTEVI